MASDKGFIGRHFLSFLTKSKSRSIFLEMGRKEGIWTS